MLLTFAYRGFSTLLRLLVRGRPSEFAKNVELLVLRQTCEPALDPQSGLAGGTPRLRGTLGGEKRPDPDDRGVDVRRAPLEIGEQVVCELGQCGGVEVLDLVRILPSLRPRPVECGVQLA
jgi:hypothetical protein